MRSNIGASHANSLGSNSWRASLDSPTASHQHHQHHQQHHQHHQQQQQQPASTSLASITTGQLVQGTNGDIYIMVTPNGISTTASPNGSLAATTVTVSGAALSNLASSSMSDSIYQLQPNVSTVSVSSSIADQHQQTYFQSNRGLKRSFTKQQQQQQQLGFGPDTDGLLNGTLSSGSNSNSSSSGAGGGGGPVIASVVGSNGQTGGSGLSACCDREKRRKSCHNEVERRRRDKINTLIHQLAEMMPAAEWRRHSVSATRPDDAEAPASPTTEGFQSLETEQDQEQLLQQRHQRERQQEQPWLLMPKSVVLKKAVDYFGQLQVRNSALVRESKQLMERASKLEARMTQLESENAKLKKLLGQQDQN